MAYSISYASGNGSTNSFSLAFDSGFLSRSDVTCRVDDEVDGFGNPIYRSITWITDGLVTISGTPPLTGTNNVQFIRTVSPTTLVHDYANGVAIEEVNLDESNLQALMLLQEYLDGRHQFTYTSSVDMNGQKVTNIAAGTAASDAVRYDQLEDIPDLAAATSADAGVAEASADAAEAAAVTAAAAAVTAIGSRWGSSTTSLAIGTGAKTFSTQAGLALLSGVFGVASSQAAPEKYMYFQVTSYSGTTLVVNVLSTGGTGTAADWNISPSGPQGASGSGAGVISAGLENEIPYYAANGTTLTGGDAATILGLLGTGSAALADVLDEDDFATDSAVNPPSQQSTKAYIASALSSSHGKQLFTSPGSFTVPAGITTVYISGSGGGGGGGGSYYTGDGSSGGTTSFGVLVSLTGGTGGKGAYATGVGGGGSSAGGNYNGGNGSVQDTTAANGGVGGGRGGGKGGLYVGGGASAASAALANSGSGGGGGAVVKSSVPLAGGGGGAGQTQPPTAYTVTAEASYTVTIGAAGGGGSGGGSSHVAGGSGAAGWLLVEW